MPGSDFASRSADDEAVAVGRQRARKVALRDLHVADLVVRHREIALPAGVAGIGLRQPVKEDEAAAVGFQRARKVALRDLHVADPVVRHRQVALPAGVAGIGFRQPVSDRRAVLIGLERSGEVALRGLNVAGASYSPEIRNRPSGLSTQTLQA